MKNIYSKRPKHLLLDCDGVIADLTSDFLRWVEKEFGIRKRPEEIQNWGYAEQVGITQEQEDEYFNGPSAYGHCLGLPRYPGAERFVKDLQRNHVVRACTATKYTAWTAARAEWLDYVGIPPEQQIILGKTEKQRHVADHLIDDSKTNCLQYARFQNNLQPSFSRERAILLDRPWNQYADYKERWEHEVAGVRRAMNYEEVLEIVG